MLRVNTKPIPATENVAPAQRRPRTYSAHDVEMAILSMDQVLLEGVASMEQLAEDIAALGAFQAAVEAHGYTADLAAYNLQTELLSSASMVPSLESFSDDTISQESLNTAALEGIIDTIKEKASALASKAWDFLKGFGSKITDFCKKAISWLGDLAVKVKNKTVDLSKAAWDGVKAHPYATVAAAVGLLAAAGGAYALIGKGVANPATMQTVAENLKSMISKANLPGVKAVVENGLLKVTTAGKTAATAMKNAAGWTSANFLDLIRKAKDAVAGIAKIPSGAFSSMTSALKSGFSKALSGAGDYARFAAGMADTSAGMARAYMKAGMTVVKDAVDKTNILSVVPASIMNNHALMSGVKATGKVGLVYLTLKWMTASIEAAYRVFVVLPYQIVKAAIGGIVGLFRGKSEMEGEPAAA